MEREQGRGGQYDPAECVIAEQQGPVNLYHEAAIRRTVWGRVEDGRNPDSHPLRKGNIRQPEDLYSGIARAWRAEELEHAEVDPGSDH